MCFSVRRSVCQIPGFLGFLRLCMKESGRSVADCVGIDLMHINIEVLKVS
jgi:hypothetical protein